jgi:hypothetical protein
LIENITGFTGDDLIALTAIPGTSDAGAVASTMVSDTRDRGEGQDDIRQVIIRNVRGYCAGGHHIVRLLNTSGVRMYDIVLDGLIDTLRSGVRCKAAVKIGDSNYGDGVAPMGDTSRIIVSNVISRSKHTILLGGTLCDSIINNVIRHEVPGDPVTLAGGPDSVQRVTRVNLGVAGAAAVSD